MKLNLDVVPSNLDEAVQVLTKAIDSEQEKENMKDPVGLHFNFGMYLRNNWSLWERDTVLVKWFKENLGISHADDISGTILEALAASLEGREFDAKKHVRIYIEHWERLGIKDY